MPARLGLPKSSTLHLVAEGSFSSHGKCSSLLSCWKALECHRVLQKERKKERGGYEEQYVIWVNEAPDVSLPFGTPSLSGCLTEHCNSWHCIACL